MADKNAYNSETGGVAPMSIEGKFWEQRERLRGMTDEDRKLRHQFLKDQQLAPHEPVAVPEMYYDLVNPIRRFYRKPLDLLFEKLKVSERYGPDNALAARFITGKMLMLIGFGYITTYYFMYNAGDWTTTGRWHIHKSREAVLPGEPGYPQVSTRKFSDYNDRGFKDAPI